jgi:hypothetical protein
MSTVHRRNRLVNARQMGGQCAAIDPSFPLRHIGDLSLLVGRLGLGDRLLEVLQRQIELIGVSLASRSLFASKPCTLRNRATDDAGGR